MQSTLLDQDTLQHGVTVLAQHDPVLAAVAQRLGTPPLWDRPPGFGTLVWIILEQQVSLASARAAYTRLQAAADPLTPAAFLSLDDVTLAAIGFSRQKRAYARHLAESLVAGTLDLAALDEMGDEAVRARLQALPGIGPWTAEIYLLMALRRADAWPAGDLGLVVAAQELFGLESRPGAAQLTELAERWRPWRAVAARLLWHHYLSK
jgi:DNA-3-methyladenine glycosylase II